MAKSFKINREIRIHEVVKVKAPIVEALQKAVDNPTYQFHIPGHTKGRAVFSDFKKLIGEKALNPVKVLERVGLGERLDNFPAQLSGGEQQRVSIARALAKNPKILLCDEPTGALDYNTGKQILKLLQDTSRESGMTIVVITHNAALAPMADRIITVKSGRVVKNEVNENPVSVEEIDW